MRQAWLALALAACGGAASAAPTASRVDADRGPSGEIVGVTTRAEIESELPAWREAIAIATIDTDAAERLAHVAAGAEVDVFLGTWCGDSRREVARLFRALERPDGSPPLPFVVRFIGVDRAKAAPGLTEGADLRYVPTIIVRREGVEIGRIIESVPDGVGVERALLGLLDDSRTGVISGRPGL